MQPQLAIFGKKDYQQLCVMREMIRQLNLSIEIDEGETVRASDGLALSSRNRFLNKEERTEAACLFQVLSKIKLEIETGNKNFEKLQNTAREALISRGWDVDYIALQECNTLAPAQVNNGALVVLGAAKLGETRLIDNLEISAEI